MREHMQCLQLVQDGANKYKCDKCARLVKARKVSKNGDGSGRGGGRMSRGGAGGGGSGTPVQPPSTFHSSNLVPSVTSWVGPGAGELHGGKSNEEIEEIKGDVC
jgi:hypothetical protein